MLRTRLALRLLLIAVVGLVPGRAGSADAAEMDKTVRIGSLGDQSSIAADVSGVGSVIAARMAIEDFGLPQEGWTIDVIAADHQNKADLATSIARRWVDVDKVDAFVDLGNSAIALATSTVAREKNVVSLVSGAATSELTGSQCSPNTVHWVFNTYLLANTTGRTLVKAGGNTWFFLTADYAFGNLLQTEASKVVTQSGGKVLGSVKHPFNNADFASYLLQAQASGAKVIALANAANDTVTSVKQANEFGIGSGDQTLVALLLYLTDVHSLGLKLAQGLYLTETFYCDMNDEPRAFTKRFNERYKKSPPTMVMAGVYSSTLHYLKALKALGGNPHDGARVVAKMKELPTDDPLFGQGRIRGDGQKIHPAYLFRVKTPSESMYPWDYYKLIETVPADDAFIPLEMSDCPLVKH
jgi:branched-chain amino acid transport system substrate-binding protein